MNQNPDRNTTERLEEARFRASKLLAMVDLLEVEISPEVIREAALVPISPEAERFGAWALNLARVNIQAVVLVLAGQAPDAVITEIMNAVDSPKALPARRPRSTAADRARRADEWLAGPARELGPEPEPSPDGGAP
jgi:hypothetical protein